VQYTRASLLLYLADILLFCAAQCEKEYHVGCLQSQWQVELKVSAEQHLLFDRNLLLFHQV
jgi:hypothetical protein